MIGELSPAEWISLLLGSLFAGAHFKLMIDLTKAVGRFEGEVKTLATTLHGVTGRVKRLEEFQDHQIYGAGE